MANLYGAAAHGEARIIHLSVVTRATSQLDKGNVSYRSILADVIWEEFRLIPRKEGKKNEPSGEWPSNCILVLVSWN
jgi:hypothetical protein